MGGEERERLFELWRRWDRRGCGLRQREGCCASGWYCRSLSSGFSHHVLLLFFREHAWKRTMRMISELWMDAEPSDSHQTLFQQPYCNHVIHRTAYDASGPRRSLNWHCHCHFSLCDGMPQLRVKATAVLLRELYQDTVGRVRLLTVPGYSSARIAPAYAIFVCKYNTPPLTGMSKYARPPQPSTL